MTRVEDVSAAAHKAVGLVRAAHRAVDEFSRTPVTIAEVLLGSVGDHLSRIPVTDMHGTLAGLDKLLKGGDDEVTVAGYTHTLSECRRQLAEALEMADPFLKYRRTKQ